MTTEATTETTEATPTEAPSLDEQLRAIAAEASQATADQEAETTEETPAEEPKPEAAKPPAKAAETASAKLLRTKAVELTNLEVSLAAKRGELATKEAAFADKLAKADRFDAFVKQLADDPKGALEELIGDEDFADFTNRIARAALGHDPKTKKLSGVEKELAEVKAKLDAQEKARADEAAQIANARNIQAGIAEYKKLTVEGKERWPSLHDESVNPDELLKSVSNYRLRIEAASGVRPSFEDANDAIEEYLAPIVAKEIAKREAAKAEAARAAAKPAPKGNPKMLAPDAGTQRTATRELSLEEQLAAIVKEHNASARALAGCEASEQVAK